MKFSNRYINLVYIFGVDIDAKTVFGSLYFTQLVFVLLFLKKISVRFTVFSEKETNNKVTNGSMIHLLLRLQSIYQCAA